MIDTNALLVDFIGKNWMGLLLIYSTVRAMFPSNKVLTAIGDSFSGLFPVSKFLKKLGIYCR